MDMFTTQQIVITFFTLGGLGISITTLKTIRSIMKGETVSEDDRNNALTELEDNDNDHELLDGVYGWMEK